MHKLKRGQGYPEHPIVTQSFAVIDREMGDHPFDPQAYQVLRRVVHSTADFDYRSLLQIQPGAIASAMSGLAQGLPIVTDVGMVAQGIRRVAARTFGNPVVVAVDQVTQPLPHKTLSESGLLACCQTHPQAIYAIGNAPTALLALCGEVELGTVQPTCIVGAPVGFIRVVEAKQSLAQLSIPQIRVDGRKGGSGVAAAIVNALLILAWERYGAIE